MSFEKEMFSVRKKPIIGLLHLRSRCRATRLRQTAAWTTSLPVQRPIWTPCKRRSGRRAGDK